MKTCPDATAVSHLQTTARKDKPTRSDRMNDDAYNDKSIDLCSGFRFKNAQRAASTGENLWMEGCVRTAALV